MAFLLAYHVLTLLGINDQIPLIIATDLYSTGNRINTISIALSYSFHTKCHKHQIHFVQT